MSLSIPSSAPLPRCVGHLLDMGAVSLVGLVRLTCLIRPHNL